VLAELTLLGNQVSQLDDTTANANVTNVLRLSATLSGLPPIPQTSQRAAFVSDRANALLAEFRTAVANTQFKTVS
jgi:hypothetical protein